MSFYSIPFAPERIAATEARLEAIYEAARYGLKGDALAMRVGLTPAQFRRLAEFDPLVEMAKRMRRRIVSARDAADDAGQYAVDPIPSLNTLQAVAYAEEIAQRARQVIEEWRLAANPRRSQLLARAVIQLKAVIEHAARDQEPVEPAATAVEG